MKKRNKTHIVFVINDKIHHMGYAEMRTGNRTLWKGIDFIVTKPAENFLLLTTDKGPDEKYQ